MSTVPLKIIAFSEQRECWIEFANPIASLLATTTEELGQLLDSLDDALASGWAVAGFMTYEAASVFDGLATRPRHAGLPLAHFGVYDPVNLRRHETLDQLAPQPESFSSLPDLVAELTPSEYGHRVEQILREIKAGRTYQANFSYRMRARWHGDPFALFSELFTRQRTPYAAFIDSLDFSLLSLSPEQFFSVDGLTITTQPMKGTAPRGRWCAEDQQIAANLRADLKSQAENIMIVDMLRNDLSRIPTLKEVQAKELLRVERYPTVWQMTSKVQAQGRVKLSDLFNGLFPCASVTGAPKVSTMKIIAEQELSSRGVYCGAIGFALSEREMQFNVPIRTLSYFKQGQTIEYGVGSGIVADSSSANEYQECCQKVLFLTRSAETFDLFETMRWTPQAGFRFIEYHLERLRCSAEYFSFSYDREKIDRQLQLAAAQFGTKPVRVRLKLTSAGLIFVDSFPFSPSVELVKLKLAKESLNSRERLLYHKTTDRRIYEQFRARAQGADQVVLWNEAGHITETDRANIIVEIEGAWFTPALESGLLPGVYRQWLLDQGLVRERRIFIDELLKANRIYVVSSLQGIRSALVVH